jgi:hypothetical protein
LRNLEVFAILPCMVEYRIVELDPFGEGDLSKESFGPWRTFPSGTTYEEAVKNLETTRRFYSRVGRKFGLRQREVTDWHKPSKRHL